MEYLSYRNWWRVCWQGYYHTETMFRTMVIMLTMTMTMTMMVMPSREWRACPPRRRREWWHLACPPSSHRTPLPAEQSGWSQSHCNISWLGIVWSSDNQMPKDRYAKGVKYAKCVSNFANRAYIKHVTERKSGLPWRLLSCFSRWSTWRWSRSRRHKIWSSLASKPFEREQIFRQGNIYGAIFAIFANLKQIHYHAMLVNSPHRKNHLPHNITL